MTMTLMGSKIFEGSRVLFPSGAVSAKTKITGAIKLLDNRIALLLSETPFHPVDADWPDQPADRGFLKFVNRELVVKNCQIFAIAKDDQEVKEKTKANIPRDQKERFVSVVGHVVDLDESEVGELFNAEVNAEVDQEYRKQLNLHHTACHLAALALNLATKSYWIKNEAAKDSLGSSNLDQEAMDTSFIFENRSEDSYRFGTSIKKKKGLQTEKLISDLRTIEAEVNETLKKWISKSSEVKILTEGPFLDDRRTWNCTLPEGEATMPCGGTHLENLDEIATIEYSITKQDKEKELYLLATTRAISKSK